jgi:hypothetical protein
MIMKIMFGIVWLMLSLAVEAAGQPVTWDFENETGNWKPRQATVMVERVM